MQAYGHVLYWMSEHWSVLTQWYLRPHSGWQVVKTCSVTAQVYGVRAPAYAAQVLVDPAQTGLQVGMA